MSNKEEEIIMMVSDNNNNNNNKKKKNNNENEECGGNGNGISNGNGGDGGYNSKNVVEEDREKALKFLCNICQCIAREPTETQPCGHLFCKQCLNRYMNPSNNGNINGNGNSNNGGVINNNNNIYCPNCKTNIESINSSAFIKREILQLKFQCHNYNRGCNWIGELNKLLLGHELECLFRQCHCQYCGKTTYLKNQEQEHWDQCLEYPITCIHCHQSNILRKDMEKHVQDDCKDILIVCPNPGCEEEQGHGIARKHLPFHLKRCKMGIITCPFEEFGCQISKGTLIRKDLEHHQLQHRWMHYELKQLYLERLALSTELIRVSCAHEISGVYERQWKKAWDGHPLYYHRENDKKALIRFDSSTRRWLIIHGDQIIAERCGMFPTPTAYQEEFEFLEESENEKDVEEKKEQHEHNSSTNILPRVSKEENEKGKKKWHTMGEHKFRIEVTGCTQRELDLEWNLMQIMVQNQKNRSSKSNSKTTTTTNSKGKLTGVLCKCGKDLIKTKINRIYTGNSTVTCNICECQIPPTENVFHCTTTTNMQHLQGFDLCETCAEARRQSQYIQKRVPCACGKTMLALLAHKCYPFCSAVACNQCKDIIKDNLAVFHCPNNKSKLHSNGYDLCLKCADTIANAQNNTSKKTWGLF